MLSACGGGGGTGAGGGGSAVNLRSSLLPANSDNLGNVRITLPANSVYRDINDEDGVVVVLEGVGTSELGSGDVGPSDSRLYVYGRVNADGSLDLTDTIIQLDDANGYGVSGSPREIEWEDGNARAATPLAGPATVLFPNAENYDYVRFLEWETTNREGNIVLGVSTKPGDMPSNDLVSYSGDSIILRTSGGNVTAFGLGNSTVNANFGTGRVNALVSATVGIGGTAEDIVMNATNMVIDGNSFAGGPVGMTSNGSGSLGSIVGAGAETDAAGIFYGPADDGPGFDDPAEVGGYIQAGGSLNTYRGFYVADAD